MSVETMFDLSNFGRREIAMAIELLQKYMEEVPDRFYDEGVQLASNSYSGNVFLTNEEFQVLMMNGDDLEMFYSTPYEGKEGFADELKSDFEGDPESWHPEDIEFLHDNGVLDDDEWEAYENSVASSIELECEKPGADGEYFTFTVDRKWLADYLENNHNETIYEMLKEYNSEQSAPIFEDATLNEDSELETDYKLSGD